MSGRARTRRGMGGPFGSDVTDVARQTGLGCGRFLAVGACPGCGSTACRATGPVVEGSVTFAGGRGYSQPPYAVRECAACGLLYKDNTASPAELEAYYAAADFRKWETPGHFPTERAVLAVLRGLPRGSRILDFGCSSGRLLAPLTRDYRCHGFEVNAPAAAEAAAKGIAMAPADFLERVPPGTFDALVLVDVFEHLSAPTILLRKLCAALTPGGLLLIVTGNGDAVACRLEPAQFWYFRNIEHLCMLTRRSAEYLARVPGARLERWQEVSHYDLSLPTRLKREAQHFSYWQFRRRTFAARTILPLLPLFRRAAHWPIAPAYDVSRDHVLLGLRRA